MRSVYKLPTQQQNPLDVMTSITKLKEPVHPKEPQMGEACIVMMRQIVQSSCALAMWHDALVWNGDEWCLLSLRHALAKFHLQASSIQTHGHVTTEIGYHHRTCWLPNDTKSCQSTAVKTWVQCLGPPKGTCMNAMPPALRAQQSVA